MPFLEKGNVRIRYEEAGSGFPLFIIYGGGLNSIVSYANGPFDAVAEFRSEYRCITIDLRNANGGQSTGPLDFDRPWDAHTADQLGLLDHLGAIVYFLVRAMGMDAWRADRADRRTRPDPPPRDMT